MEKMTEEQIYAAAKQRVRQKKDFYNHLAVYIVVNAALVLIWYLTGHGYPWFVWPLLGWGIGIIFHGLDALVFHKQSAWEQREIEKEAEKLRKSGENG
jgi:hypothetical protein